MKKNIKKLVLIVLLAICMGIIGLSIFIKYLEHRQRLNYCGTWGPLVGGTPTCNCDGTIVKKGGPSGPADDSGGYYECVGTIIPDSK